MRQIKGVLTGLFILALMGCTVQEKAVSSKAMPEA